MDKFKDYNIVLFSASPRRAELLKALNVGFTVAVGAGDESFPANLTPTEIAQFIAEKKSNFFLKPLENNDILITADTIVVLDDQILGKPSDRKHAISILESLSNRKHSVITAYTIRTKDKFISSHSQTDVVFKKLTRSEIEYYVDTFKPYDKAGAYGIQEWIGYIGVESINGSYYNVMGLPVDVIYRDLNKIISVR